MKKMKKTFGFLLCLLMTVSLLLAGCNGIPVDNQPSAPASATATPTPAPAVSVEPASPSATAPDTAMPTDTASPTLSPSADVSPTPSPSPDVSPSPSPTATTPAATPTPQATAQTEPASAHDGDRSDVTVTQYYGKNITNSLPDGLAVSLKYSTYWKKDNPLMNFVDYFVVYPRTSTVRELPNTKAKSLQTVHVTNRLPLLAKVKGTDGKSVWYRVRVAGSAGIGYIQASAGTPHVFQLSAALQKIQSLKAVADQPSTVRVANYNNARGLPPKLPSGKMADSFGVMRDQSAPAYLLPDATSSFRYAPDGSIGQLYGTKGDFSEVYFPSMDQVRYVPTKYLSYKDDAIKTLTQVMVVDRKNENIMVFELINNQWTIVSMSFVSTGANKSAYKPTPLGDFFTEKHVGKKLGLGEFFYFADSTPPNDANGNPQFEGYAPYAIRFTGGAYLHGMPISVSYDETLHLRVVKRTAEVYGNFIGVYPASHMCVRNYTSHAKFMYNWVKDGQAAVIVIE